MTAPLRTCQGCRQADEQSALERFTLLDGVLTRDERRRLGGRGVWVHPDEACRTLVLRKGGFARGLRRKVVVPDDLFA